MSHLRSVLGLQSSCGIGGVSMSGCPTQRSNSCGGIATINGNLTPIGSMTLFAGQISSIPPGWIVCDGSYFSKSVFPTLFGVIGFNYGHYTANPNPNLTAFWEPRTPDMTQFAISFPSTGGVLLWIIRAL